MITPQETETLPKNVVQKRNYVLVEPNKNAGEFDYASLRHSRDCPIILGNDLHNELPPRLAQLGADRYYIVTDSNVKRLYGDRLLQVLRNQGFEANMLWFGAGEHSKTFATLNRLANEVLDQGLTKNSCLVALGGGVVGNLGGLLAALLMRGIRFVHVPTSVMSQADSTTGGKQAANTRHGKNLLGTFYEPEFIYIDHTLIETLPKREYASGIAEVIKHGLCQSSILLTLLDENRSYQEILKETIKLKTRIIGIDPRESHEGLTLVYGHTIGHAIETASNHRLSHGEAVAIGMVAAARISRELGYCSDSLVEKHEHILNRYNLPTRIPKYVKVGDILQTLLYDKKERTDKTTFVLLEDEEKIKTCNGAYRIPVNHEVIGKVVGELRSTRIKVLDVPTSRPSELSLLNRAFHAI